MIDKQIKEKKDCSGCYGCYNVCPVNCITMEIDSEGFWYPKVDYDKCINCKQCIAVCPIINPNEKNNIPEAYACFNKNDAIRLESSSGGIFTLLAEKVLADNGVIFGVSFDENFNVKHSYITLKKQLGKFRGSKYVQSKVGDTLKEARKYLNEGRKVLYTGTPCQIEGLKSYLRKDYDNLICIDNICHGVPSPKVWEKYLKELEKNEKKIIKFSFRSKTRSWKNYNISTVFSNSNKKEEVYTENSYMKAFLKDISLRPSCYDCAFKGLNRISDITLADFWGIENIIPKMDDDKGTSLILINTSKGKKILEEIKQLLEYEKVDVEEAVKYNPSAIKSVKKHQNRDDFFYNLDTMNFDKLVNKYCKLSLKEKIKNYIYLILKKLGLIKFLKKILNR